MQRSSRRWLRTAGGLTAVVASAVALILLYILLNPARARLYVDVASYPQELTDLVPPGYSTDPRTLREWLPNFRDEDVVNTAATDKAPSLDAAPAAIVFVNAAMLSGDDGPFAVADWQTTTTIDGLSSRRLRLAGTEGKGEGETPRRDETQDSGGALAWLQPVLDRARGRPEEGIAGKPTLLILEIGEPRANWRAGTLAPFAAATLLNALRIELESDRPPRLAVLASCTPGERSCSVGGKSLFAWTVAAALRGAADGAAGKEEGSDGRVSAREFGRFVSVSLNAWVEGHRASEGQHPVWLIPRGENFDLTYVSGEVIGLRLPARDDALLTELTNAWAIRDRAWKAEEGKSPGAIHSAPLDWIRANDLLIRAENCWLAGDMTSCRRLIKRADGSLELLAPHAPASFEPPTSAAEQLQSFAAAVPPGGEERLDEIVKNRALAQEVATRSPRALPLIASQLERADAERRQAEDALFLDDFEAARRHSEAAAALYTRAGEIASEYEASCRGLERLLARLPWLARWAANQPFSESLVSAFIDSESGIPSGVQVDGSSADFCEPIAGLLAETRKLRRDLEQVESERTAGSDEAERAELLSRLQDLRKRFDVAVGRLIGLEERLRSEALDDLGDKGLGREERRISARSDIEKMLADAILPAGERQKALLQLAELDREIAGLEFEDSRLAGKAPVATVSFDFDAIQRDLVKQAVWQGLWALLVRSLDPDSEGESESNWGEWTAAAELAVSPSEQRSQEAQAARAAAERLGDRLQAAWKRSLKQLRTRPEDDGRDDLWLELTRRDRIARCAPGVDAHALGDRNPAADLIAWSSAELSLFLAGQALEDFYAGASGELHWFDVTAEHHLDRAGELARGAPGERLLEKRIDELQQRRSSRAALAFRFRFEPERVEFGSYVKRSVQLAARVVENGPSGARRETSSSEAALPQGQAAVWLGPERGEPSDDVVRVSEAARRPVQLGSASEATSDQASLDFTLNRLSQSASSNVVRLRARLFFRGHGTIEPQFVVADPSPPGTRTVAAKAAPVTGEIVVNGRDWRSILIVLDCSGSMLEPLPDGTQKFQSAKDTLITTLTKLRDESKDGQGHRVGLVAFGHRLNSPARAGAPDRPNPDWPANDLPQSAARDHQLLAPLQLLDGAAGLIRFDAELDRLRPWGITPLVNSIDFALGSLPDNAPASIIVITDGADTDLNAENASGPAYRQVTERARGKLGAITSDLKARQKRGAPVQVHLVGFAVTGAERKSIQEVITAVCEPSNGKQLDNARSQADLEKFLDAATTPRPYAVQAVGTNPPNSYRLGEPAKELSQGVYEVSYPDVRSREITIHGGERIDLEIRGGALRARKYQNGPDAVRFELANEPPDSGDAPDSLVGRSFDVEEGGKASLLMSLDRIDQSGGRPRITEEGFIERPAEVWFEARDRDDKLVRNLSWSIEGYDLPTWRLSLDPVPADHVVKVTARWRMTPTQQDPELVISRREAGKRSLRVATKAGDAVLHLKSFERDAGAPGRVVARFEPDSTLSQGVREQLERLWVRLDPDGQADGEFHPRGVRTERTFFFEEGAIEFVFDASDVDLDVARLGVISPEDREEGAATATLELSQ